MLVIFLLSSREAVKSTYDSNLVGDIIAPVIEPEYKSWDLEKQQDYLLEIDFPIRKIAHFTEYTVLGALIILSLNQNRSWYINVVISWIIGTTYACTDELHQRFVKGRSCQITDVMLDSGGVLFGAFILICIVALYVRLKASKKQIKSFYKAYI